jgi:hypothetical protein
VATINLSDLFDGSIYITATKKDDDTYRLYWHDGVAGEWEETYPTLSVALARAAVLAKCNETQWNEGFNELPEAFAVSGAAFVASQITGTGAITDPQVAEAVALTVDHADLIAQIDLDGHAVHSAVKTLEKGWRFLDANADDVLTDLDNVIAELTSIRRSLARWIQ